MRAFRSAANGLDLPCRIVGTDVSPLAPALHEVDVPALVPRVDDPAYVPLLVDLCREHSVAAVFPLIDPDVPVLAAAREALEDVGAQVMAIAPDAVATVSDKRRTTDFFRSIGLDTPPSWLPGDPALQDPELLPLIVKPRRGSAAKNVFVATTPAELAFFASYVPDPIIQELLPGPEITIDVVCDHDGQVLAVVCRQRIEVRWGEVAKGVTIKDPTIVEAGIEVARRLPAIGPFTLQCMMKDGRPHYTEINARLGGGLPLGIAAGADSPRLLLASIAGISQPPSGLAEYDDGVLFTRFDDSRFMTQEEVARFESRHLRSG